MIRYEDFSLKIEPSREDVFPVIVLRSPAGEGRSQFRLPFEPDQIGEITRIHGAFRGMGSALGNTGVTALSGRLQITGSGYIKLSALPGDFPEQYAV